MGFSHGSSHRTAGRARGDEDAGGPAGRCDGGPGAATGPVRSGPGAEARAPRAPPGIRTAVAAAQQARGTVADAGPVRSLGSGAGPMARPDAAGLHLGVMAPSAAYELRTGHRRR